MAEGKKYQIMDLVATGGTAVLYRAVQTSLDRVVAVKKLHHHLTTDENFTRRFILEAKAAASLDHENIVKIIDFGVEDGTYMMVMEFIEGQSLKDVIDKWKQIPVNLALAAVHQICMGLEHAHGKGIVHRDVKPGNIMLTRSGKVKITDFGLAKLSQAGTQHTAADSILGTPLYMSPEQAFGESVDQRSDLFSLGTVLYECLTGRQPFQGESYMGVIQNIIHQNAPHPSKLGVELPDGVGPIMAKAMNKNREARFQSAREFRLAIERNLGLDGLKDATDSLKSLLSTDGATMVLPRTERARRKSRRLKRTVAAAFSVAAFTAIVGAAYLFAPGEIRGRIAGVLTGTPDIEPRAAGSPSGLSSASISSPLEQPLLPEEGRAGLPRPAGPRDDTTAGGMRSPDTAASIGAPGVGGDATPAARVPAEHRRADDDRLPSPSGGGSLPADDDVPPAPSAGEPYSESAASPTVPRESNSTAAAESPKAAAKAVEVVKTGWLAVTSDPSAEMYLDGRYIGDTPVARIELPSGSHTIECRSPKYESYAETLHITAGELSSRRVVLAKLVGRVSLSTIEGAEVYVDGTLFGATPLASPIELDAGQHQITVKKAGFHVWNNTVTVEAKQILPLRITLSPIY